MSPPRAASHHLGRRSKSRIAAHDGAGVRLWLFDFDNTLALLEPEVDWAAGRRELEPFLRDAGVADDLFERFPRGNLPLYAALLARDNGQRPARTLLTRASALIERFELAGVDRAAPTAAALELLRALAARAIPIAIVTSNSSRTVQRWLRRHQVAETVRTIVGRDSLLPLKPAPDMIERALALCEVPTEAAALAGDSQADLLAARAAGVRFYGVCIKAAGRDALIAAGANAVFASPAALGIHLKLLDRRTRTVRSAGAQSRNGHRVRE
jgi:phosphoglycolate phosphatase-like HAD superfamily hydrolase